jgi:ribosomal protein L13E
MPAVADPAPERWSVRVVGIDGLTIEGEDFLWGDGTAAILRGGQRLMLPCERVRVVEWSPRPTAAAAPPAWLAAVPAAPTADLVAVSQGEGFELVECAITGVSPDVVTVMLDGDRIPVKRSKVLGLVWARPVKQAVGMRVAIAGGSLAADTVEWRAGELVLDGQVHVPGGWLESIDFAAGRTVRLCDLPLEKSGVEPFFGGLTAVEGLAAFFAPRVVTRDNDREGEIAARAWLLRPRTEATWRVPPGSRRFRATAIRRAAAASPAAVVVSVRADDGPAWQRGLTAADEVTIDLDVETARRLTITVDFAAGGMGCPVRFDHAVFEK